MNKKETLGNEDLNTNENLLDENRDNSYLKNFQINPKIIRKLISFTLVTMAAVLYIKGGSRRVNSNFNPKSSKDTNVTSKDNSSNYLALYHDKLVTYYKKWEKTKEDTYVREVHTYDFSKLTYEELTIFLKTRDLSIIEDNEDMHTVTFEKRSNLPIEELNQDAYFLTNYTNDNSNIQFAISLLILILGGNILFTTGNYIKHKIEYMNLEKELIEGMGYDFTYQKDKEIIKKVLKK